MKNVTTKIVTTGTETSSPVDKLERDIAVGKALKVLDKGYVRRIDAMGNDLRVVNAARVSYAKESEVLTEKDKGLIRFLVREEHTSPFRHAFVSYEVNAPLMVARQHWKYVVGSDHTMDAWNEASRRYITMEPEFYIPEPDAWRSAPANSKQGSGDPVNLRTGAEAFVRLMDTIDMGMVHYNWALENNIAAEQARLFLPAYGMYTVYWWSTSLAAVIHFLNQRLEHDAQYEIQVYAKAVWELTKDLFPVAFEAMGVNVS